MKIDCIVTDDYKLAPIVVKKLQDIQEPGNYVAIDIDHECQRSPIQLAKYWKELGDICDNMSEQAVKLLLQNIIELIAQNGSINRAWMHSCLKSIYGVDSIALAVNTPEARGYFDFAFQQLDRMRGLLYA